MYLKKKRYLTFVLSIIMLLTNVFATSANSSDITKIETYTYESNGSEYTIKLSKYNGGNHVQLFDIDGNLLQEATADLQKDIIHERIYSGKNTGFFVPSQSIIVSEKDHVLSSFSSSHNETPPPIRTIDTHNEVFADESAVSTMSVNNYNYNYLHNEPVIDDNLDTWQGHYKYIGSAYDPIHDETGYLVRASTWLNHYGAKYYSLIDYGTAVSVVVSFFTAWIEELSIENIMALIKDFVVGSIIGYSFAPTVGVQPIHHIYQVVVGNSIPFSFCRKRHYWWLQAYNAQLGYVDNYDLRYYEHGYTADNGTAVYTGIQNYSMNTIYHRPCEDY